MTFETPTTLPSAAASNAGVASSTSRAICAQPTRSGLIKVLQVVIGVRLRAVLGCGSAVACLQARPALSALGCAGAGPIRYRQRVLRALSQRAAKLA